MCWGDLEAARLSGAMAAAWMTLWEGDSWSPSHFPATWNPAVTTWEPTSASDPLLCEMIAVRDRVCPNAALTVGPRMREWRYAAGHACRYEDASPAIYIALATPTHPLMTLRHEMLHAVWGHLSNDETVVMEEWGDSLRATVPAAPNAEWWTLPEEAEAEAYADFYAADAGRRRRLPEPPPEVVAILHAIEAGHVGRR